MHEPAPPHDPDSSFVFSMEGAFNEAPARLLPFYWWPRWNSVQSLNKFQEEVGGAMRGGDGGVRLLEPGAADLLPRRTASAGPAGAAGSAGDDAGLASAAWRIVAAPQIFGSEELSAAAPAVAERIPPLHVALSRDDAWGLGAAAGDLVVVVVGAEALHLPVAIEPALPRGVAAVPVGLPGMPYLDLPAAGEVRKP
jgi:NADH-quinone oxidoreductase subunit G